MHLASAAAGLAALALVGPAGHGLPLREVARVSLPGPSVRFDYASIDPQANELYLAHMDASRLLVVSLRTRRVIKTISAPGVHGVLAVTQLGRVFVSATDAHEVITLDARTHAVLAHSPAGAYPDGIAYDPVERHVFVSDETGGVQTVINARGHRIATISLGGEAGNVQYDAGSHRVLVDVQTRNDVVVIDPQTNQVVRRVALSGCSHDHGLLVDAARRLAFVACDGNATLLTIDLRHLKVIGRSTVGASPDVLAFDSSLRRLYVAAESGEVAVFAEGRHGVRKLGQARLAPFAHTVAVDSQTHLVYFPLQDIGGHPTLRIMRGRR